MKEKLGVDNWLGLIGLKLMKEAWRANLNKNCEKGLLNTRIWSLG